MAAAEPPPGERAREGARILEALEGVPLALVGTVEERAALDAHGWCASLRVESALVGEAAPGALQTIAWEELTDARPPRFAVGDRVLVALEPLTSGSLWRTRFPDVAEYLRVRGVAQRGLAFVRSPAPESLSELAHYLALPASERTGPAGRVHLLALAAEAEPAVALSAATRLAQRGSGSALEPEQAALLLRALARTDPDDPLADALLAWIERSQPQGVATALDGALAAGPPPPASWVRARSLLPGGVAEERLGPLLADASPARRAAAARGLDASQTDRLRALVQRDPAPEVRRAALERAAALGGAGALEALLEGFSDPDPSVRAEAARLAARLGAVAVPRLREVALGWPDPAPETAVLALRFSEAQEAPPVLREIADTHPDSRIRALAGLALGRPLGHAD